MATIWTTGQASTCAHPTHMPPRTHTHTHSLSKPHFTTTLDTQHLSGNRGRSVPSWPVCIAKHTINRTLHLMRYDALTWTWTVGASMVSTKSWNQIISNSLLLSFSLTAHMGRGAGWVSPNALKIGPPQRVSWGLKHISGFPLVSWTCSLYSLGPAGRFVCVIKLMTVVKEKYA